MGKSQVTFNKNSKDASIMNKNATAPALTAL